VRPPVARVFLDPPVPVGFDADELIVDSFAGGGGASEGIRMALGRDPDIAINHDAEAIALHKANHPTTRHFTEDVWNVDPLKATNGKPVGLMWASPDCKHFSKAKGGKPVSKKIRGLAWVVTRWAKAVKPRVIILENVEEFQTWGPVNDDGQPCAVRKGRTFRAFISRLRRLGYDIEWRELRASNYDTPTIRKRLFVIARCDGQPIVWPDPTNGDAPGLKPVRTAAECIDWSIPCPSIFGRKKPLAQNTLKRIHRGVFRFVINSPKPFIVNMAHGGKNEAIDAPISTIATEKGGCRAIVTPIIAGVGGRAGQSPERRLDQPVQTITSKGDAAIIAPTIMPMQHQNRSASPDEPLQTVTTQGNKFNIVAPTLVRTAHGEVDKNGKKRGQNDPSMGDPMPTVTASGDVAVVAPTLVSLTHHGSDRVEDVAEPFKTVTGAHRGEKALVAAHITKFRSGATGAAGDEPMPTVTANSFIKRPGGAAPLGLVEVGLTAAYPEGDYRIPLPGESSPDYWQRMTDHETKHGIDPHQGSLGLAFLAQHNTGNDGHDARTPLSTIIGKGCTQGVVEVAASHISQLNGTSTGQPVDEPLNAIAAQGNHFAEVRAFLITYYGTEQRGELFDPLHSVTSRDRFGLVTVNGVDYQIVDIGLRMLAPRELYNAQGFRVDYAIDIDFTSMKKRKRAGRWVLVPVTKPMTKTAQVRMVGNSVCPPMAKALVAANYKPMQAEVRAAA
jgi:DNA (cytosine-5)-methyltransferase 1